MYWIFERNKMYKNIDLNNDYEGFCLQGNHIYDAFFNYDYSELQSPYFNHFDNETAEALFFDLAQDCQFFYNALLYGKQWALTQDKNFSFKQYYLINLMESTLLKYLNDKYGDAYVKDNQNEFNDLYGLIYTYQNDTLAFFVKDCVYLTKDYDKYHDNRFYDIIGYKYLSKFENKCNHSTLLLDNWIFKYSDIMDFESYAENQLNIILEYGFLYYFANFKEFNINLHKLIRNQLKSYYFDFNTWTEVVSDVTYYYDSVLYTTLLENLNYDFN